MSAKLNSLFTGFRSQFYDQTMGRVFASLYDYAAVEIAGFLAEGHVLDVGAGSGELALKIHHNNSKLQITGIDLSADMIAIATEKGIEAGAQEAIVFETQSVTKLPYADAQFTITPIQHAGWLPIIKYTAQRTSTPF